MTNRAQNKLELLAALNKATPDYDVIRQAGGDLATAVVLMDNVKTATMEYLVAEDIGKAVKNVNDAINLLFNHIAKTLTPGALAEFNVKRLVDQRIDPVNLTDPEIDDVLKAFLVGHIMTYCVTRNVPFDHRKVEGWDKICMEHKATIFEVSNLTNKM